MQQNDQDMPDAAKDHLQILDDRINKIQGNLVNLKNVEESKLKIPPFS